jgi:SAM-dependent methyltransferase
VTDATIHHRVSEYYGQRLREHGPTPRGVDWNSAESQERRFRELARLWDGDPTATVVDYGCGYGALARYLRTIGHTGSYTGYDLSEPMIATARAQAADLPDCRFTTVRTELPRADYAVASGIFNVKLDTPATAWHAYMLDTISDIASLGTRGFAFNALTAYSDADRQRPDLYYTDPLACFEHCRAFSRFVALLHDYPLYEFTMLVRFQAGSSWPHS